LFERVVTLSRLARTKLERGECMPVTRRSRRILALIAAGAVCVGMAACGSQDQADGTAVLCGDGPGSISEMAAELSQVQAESDLAVFGPALSDLADNLADLDLDGEQAAARDRAVSAVRETQSAAQEQGELDPNLVLEADRALRDFGETYC
jgi:hypothetical protein